MLHHKQVPEAFWAEALSMAVYIRNRMTTRGLPSNVTPYELWYSQKPNVGHLPVFGRRCWYKVVDHKLKWLEDRAAEAVFLGYIDGSNGYKLWDFSRKQIVVSLEFPFDGDANCSKNYSSFLGHAAEIGSFDESSIEEAPDLTSEQMDNTVSRTQSGTDFEPQEAHDST